MKRNFMKKILSALTVTAMATSMLLAAGCGSSSTSSNSSAASSSNPEDYANALQGKKLQIACDVSFVPFMFPDENNQYVGFDVDLLNAMSDYLGFTYELQPMEFTALLSSVQAKKVDLGSSGITITDERKKVMDFSDPYYDSATQILVKDDSDIKDFDDLHGKTVSMKIGTAPVKYIEEHYPDVNIKEFNTSDEAYLEVARGSADASVFETPNMLYYIKQNPNSHTKVVGTKIDACQYGILFPKHSELTKYFNAALAKLKADGTYDKIYEKWFGEAPQQ